MDQACSATVLIAFTDSSFCFLTKGGTTKKPDEAKVFTSTEDLLDRLRDVLYLSRAKLSQVRIIGQGFGDSAIPAS